MPFGNLINKKWQDQLTSLLKIIFAMKEKQNKNKMFFMKLKNTDRWNSGELSAQYDLLIVRPQLLMTYSNRAYLILTLLFIVPDKYSPKLS